MSSRPQFFDILSSQNESRSKEMLFKIYYFVNYSENYFYWIIFHITLNGISESFILISFESVLAFFTEHACSLFQIIG